MNLRHLATAAALFAAGTAGAQTEPLSLGYNFVELRFVDTDFPSGDGLKFGGSYRVKDNWLLVGSLTTINVNTNVDSTTIEIGGGYAWPWQQGWDLVGSIRYVNTSVDTPGGDVDDSGVIFEGGIRGLLTPQFELRGSANHITIGDSDTFLELGGDFYFSPNFAAGITFELAGDTDVLTFGARWFFR